MRVDQNSHGFTVIEVIIFLSISGLLVIVAFMGTGTAIARAQFKDGMHSTQAHIQQQYANVQNGLNLREEDTSALFNDCYNGGYGAGLARQIGRSKCLLLGRLVTFEMTGDKNSIVTYPVVGLEPSSVADLDTLGEDALLKAYQPQVIENTSEEFDMPWGVELLRSCVGSDGTSTTDRLLGECVPDPMLEPDTFDSLLIIRSPRSGSVQTYVFEGGWGLTKQSDIQVVNPSRGYIDLDSADPNKRIANMCFVSQGTFDQYGGIQIGGNDTTSQGGSIMTIDMDQTTMESVCGA